VALKNSECQRLCRELEARGWTRQGDVIGPPDGTMGLALGDPWTSTLDDLRQRMQRRLARLLAAGKGVDPGAVHDTAALVQVLTSITASV
jgi:hypothetical protein